MSGSDINFCPYCDASQHKILAIKEDSYFCKSCSKFFDLRMQNHDCPKCASHNIGMSDFPSPSGEPVFQCKKCKKLFKSSEFLSGVRSQE